MTYDSPFYAIEGEVIPEVVSFKEKFGDPRRMRRRKRKFENLLDHAGN